MIDRDFQTPVHTQRSKPICHVSVASRLSDMLSGTRSQARTCVARPAVSSARAQRSVAARAVNVEQLKSAKGELEELVRTTSCAPILVRLGELS